PQPPTPRLEKPDPFDDVNVIRKPPFGLLEFREPAGIIALPVIAIIAKSKMRFRQVRIKRESTIGSILGCREARRAWIESEPVTATLRTGETRPRQGKTGIQLHRLLK